MIKKCHFAKSSCLHEAIYQLASTICQIFLFLYHLKNWCLLSGKWLRGVRVSKMIWQSGIFYYYFYDIFQAQQSWFIELNLLLGKGMVCGMYFIVPKYLENCSNVGSKFFKYVGLVSSKSKFLSKKLEQHNFTNPFRKSIAFSSIMSQLAFSASVLPSN